MRRFHTRLRGGASYSPLVLFAGGAQGAWFDPADFSTLFQDSAGTTPVTATGQPVGKILDKSGRGNHATQATSTKRPILQQDGSGYYYLSFDGVDDGLVTASVDFTSTAQMTVFAGVTNLSDAAAGMVVESSSNAGANAGAFRLTVANPAATWEGVSSGTTLNINAVTAASYAAPTSKVVTLQSSIPASLVSLRVNSVAAASNAASQGTGNYGNYPLNFGSRSGGTVALNGRLYGVVVVGAAQAAANLTLTERWVGQRMGIAL